MNQTVGHEYHHSTIPNNQATSTTTAATRNNAQQRQHTGTTRNHQRTNNPFPNCSSAYFQLFAGSLLFTTHNNRHGQNLTDASPVKFTPICISAVVVVEVVVDGDGLGMTGAVVRSCFNNTPKMWRVGGPLSTVEKSGGGGRGRGVFSVLVTCLY